MFLTIFPEKFKNLTVPIYSFSFLFQKPSTRNITVLFGKYNILYFFIISGAGFAMCLIKSVSTLTMCNQKGRCLKRGKHYGEYTEMISKLYAASASTVYFKVIFKSTPVQNSEPMVKMVKIQLLLKNNC